MDTLQRLIAIQQEANGLLRRYGLLDEGWKFEFHSKQRAMGTCKFSTKTICFSKHFIMSDPEQVTDTLLHEIAHALVGEGHGHDEHWQRMAAYIGARPKSCTTEYTNTAKKNFRIKCEKCGWSITRFRLKRKLMTEEYGAYCPKCGNKDLKFYRIVHQ
jgi:predicted SprT family Zn-dependent metalloprotease